ncbi:MAG: phosphoenolpyruvate carboxykinase (GTP) [Oscillospiraceae bacterium]|nr:phosphoenolpyruvate carboxykinase (GTP) [Oscillospiraceae bacterium]
MEFTKNQAVLSWIQEKIDLCQPDSVVWIDGSQAQVDEIRALAVSEGTMIKLNQEKLPDCYLHRTDPDDVARVEDRTFICCEKEEDAGPTNHWMAPDQMYAKLNTLFQGSMKGRVMYVIPYSMGVIGSPFAKYGIELTDSTYVVLNMVIMTRVGTAVLDALGDSDDFIKGLHSYATLSKEDKYIVHMPQNNEIFSINSNYGGNVLQGKKCFALRIASNLGRQEGWMAEHMLILGLKNPKGEVRYVTAAFPSACGKTNLAMLIPPEGYKKDGWEAWTVGDDIAWLRVGEDGRLWAVNPEHGFFGVAPGTNKKSNPNALECTKRGTIYTNVAYNPADGTVWWDGLTKGDEIPETLIDWNGQEWHRGDAKKPAHPNSRFTAPAENCPCLSDQYENPNGVPISAIIFGGRRAKTAPLVYQSRDWDHGVFIGSSMASETTAAATGAVGVVRRDPFAMLPFCGYHMGDYWQHWLDMGKKIANQPKIFHVNWFRLDDEGNFAWPGFGDNLRVLDWILKRCFQEIDAVETPLGYEPRPEDINIEGLDMTVEDVAKLLSVDKGLWLEEVDAIRAYYDKIGRVPAELQDSLNTLEAKLQEA